MAIAQSAHSWHLSFLLSVRLTHTQCHDRLSIPLAGDIETTDNKDKAVRVEGGQYVHGDLKQITK